MLSLMDRAFAPALIYPDKITFMTSVRHLQSVRADNNCLAVVETIKDLLSSKSTRLQGLQFLEIALQQNPDIYLKGRWSVVLFEILKEPVSYVLKEHVCKILCLLIPYMAKDTVANAVELQKFASFLFPFLLEQVEKKVEWIESAGMCICTCLKCFPQAVEPFKENLLKICCQQIEHSVSSRTFEVFAECFSLIPSCNRDPNSYADEWKKQYLTTLNTMHVMLNTFLTHFSEDPFVRNSIPGAETFPFQEPDDIYPAYMTGVRRFINLTKCLSKMLSTKTKRPVQVPVKITLESVGRLLQVQDVNKTSSSPIEVQIVSSTLSQMRIASLVLVEALILNFPNILQYSFLIAQLIILALQASGVANTSSETISPLRHAVWRLMVQWISQHGTKVTYDIVCQQALIIEELLKDTSIENSSQATVVATTSKSKKNLGMNSGQKSFVNKSQQATCREALKALECLLYSGAGFISKNLFQEIFSKVVQVAYAVSSSGEYPFPYDDDICRKRLYSVLLAIVVVPKSDQREPIHCVSGFFRRALQDPSTKVVRFIHKAMATCRLYLHPRKPVPVIKDVDEQQVKPNAVMRFSEWSTEDYVPNLPPVENVSNVAENLNPRVAQTFRNSSEGEMPSDEYMQVDYSDQAAENQCNGEDLLDIQNSSQCQDDIDSSDEDEEEDDDHSEDEEIIRNVEYAEMQTAENIYIPSTSKVLNPVRTAESSEQNVEEQEFGELRPSKSDDSNKNMHLNGVRSNLVPEEQMPSASAQNVANENGVYDCEDDVEEEEGDEDEEEDSAVYPAEKRGPECFETCAKKQKIEEANEKPQEEKEGSRSPTLVEMKADFCCNELDNVKS